MTTGIRWLLLFGAVTVLDACGGGAPDFRVDGDYACSGRMRRCGGGGGLPPIHGPFVMTVAGDVVSVQGAFTCVGNWNLGYFSCDVEFPAGGPCGSGSATWEIWGASPPEGVAAPGPGQIYAGTNEANFIATCVLRPGAPSPPIYPLR